MTNNRLLAVSLGLLLLFTLTVFLFTNDSYELIESCSVWVRNYFGYFYLYLGLGCVLLLVLLSLSPLGSIRLGKSGQKPEHSNWAWISMLYSAGMGAGILLRAVQEPVFMLQNPPFNTTSARETLALEYTFFQWGFTPWAFYGLFAMIIGYALFVKHKKVRVSNAIEDAIPNKMARGGIDIITILTTVFGLIAAIGLGTTQINGGLNHLSESEFGLGTTLALAILISVLAFISVWRGVNKGIKMISKFNILITVGLLIIVFILSDMGAILGAFLSATFAYLVDFVPMSIAFGNYNPGLDFLTDWTFYYWAFWIAWAPFTGIFIARISKGRTIRELLLGVMIIPSIGTFLWFSVFGTSAFQLIQNWGNYQGEFDNVFSSIFVFFQHYPVAALLNFTTILLLISFLVTSVDSAVLVLSMFTDRGKKTPRRSHRFLWSVIVLLATLALIVLGHAKEDIDVLVAIQKLLIITSLPFSVFMLVMIPIFVNSLIRNKKKTA
ncbi:MAG: BCCT family transporter [Flavobacteriaceae bacterium]